MTGDAELLRRYAEEHSEDAFAELVGRHVGLVYHAALRQLGGDTHRAEDVTQAVFTDLARKGTALQRHPALASWLHLSTRFAAAKVRRSEQCRQKHEREAEIMHALLREETSAAEWERLRPMIDDVIHGLNDRDRAAVLLRFFEGRSFADVGATLALSEDAARMRVERALEKLRVSLARRGVTSTSAALGAVLAHQAAAAVPPGLALSVTGSALAAANTALAPTLAMIEFMSSSKIIAGAVGIVLVLSLGSVGYETYARREAEAALSVASRAHEALAGKRRALEQRVLTAEQDANQLEKAVAAARAVRRDAAARSAAAAVPAKEVRAWDPVEQGNAFLKRHPEVKQALDAYAKARVKFRYATLFESLQLTPAQRERLEAALLSGIGMGATGPDSHKYLTLMAGAGTFDPQAYGREINEVLDEKGRRKLREWRLNDYARDATVKVAGALWTTDTPLTPDQSDQLVEIIANSRTPPSEKNFNLSGQFDWSVVVSKASRLLSAAQLALLSGLRAEQEFNQVLSRPMTSPTAIIPDSSKAPPK